MQHIFGYLIPQILECAFNVELYLFFVYFLFLFYRKTPLQIV